jgi:hypothetical protein
VLTRHLDGCRLGVHARLGPSLAPECRLHRREHQHH